MKLFHFLLCMIVTVLLIGSFAVSASELKPQVPPVKPLRILWLGSSSTYYHDAPRDLAEWLTQTEPNTTAVSFLIGRSGTAVYKYLEPGYKFEYGLKEGQSILKEILQEKYDVVMIQVPTDFLAGQGDNDGELFIKGLRAYVSTIHQSGGRPIFYEQGWGDDEKFVLGDKLLFDLAVQQDVLVAPCRSAWKQVRSEWPDLELHNLPDSFHPGTLGKYLNLCCFYAAVTGKSPVGLPFTQVSYWPKLDADQETQMDHKLKEMDIVDPYLKRLPSWMQRNSIAARETDIGKDVAAYLQETAWQNWQAYQDRLSKARKTR